MLLKDSSDNYIVDNLGNRIQLTSSSRLGKYYSVNDTGIVDYFSEMSNFISFCSGCDVKLESLWTRDYKTFYTHESASFIQTSGFYTEDGYLFQSFSQDSQTIISLDLDHFSELYSGVNSYLTSFQGNPVTSDINQDIYDPVTNELIGTLNYALNSSKLHFTPNLVYSPRDKISDLITIEITGTNQFDSPNTITESFNFYLGYKNKLEWHDTIYCTNVLKEESLEAYTNHWIFTPRINLYIHKDSDNMFEVKDVVEILYHICPATLVVGKVFLNGLDYEYPEAQDISFEKWIISQSNLGESTPVQAGDPLSTILY
ncbi:MAG: hypothetical protein E6R13_08180 [Spirochaetes bacterium]|nr:MAG: hypothetical protein E6R13_08180 [Spirochaetota bacterium]